MKFSITLAVAAAVLQLSSSAQAKCTGAHCVNQRRSLQMQDVPVEEPAEVPTALPTSEPVEGGMTPDSETTVPVFSTVPSTIVSDTPSTVGAPAAPAPGAPAASPVRAPTTLPPPTSGSASRALSAALSVAAAVTPLLL